MVLTDTQLWHLLLIVPALVSGAVASTVAFLLGRLRRERVFSTFGRFSLATTLYGLVDGLLGLSRADLGSPWFVGLGFAALVLVAVLVFLLGRLTADLLDRPWGRWVRPLFLFPLAAAVGVELWVLATLSSWSIGNLMALGTPFLSVLFLTVLVCGVRLMSRWKEVHDRVFRRILVGTGALLVAFVPLWFLDVLAGASLGSFYWFLLVWSLGALVLASRAFFDPPREPPVGELFATDDLEACGRRFGLTPRETEIAGFHAQGYSAKDIGTRLFISPKTVRNHISNLYTKTGTGQRRELLDLLRSGR